MSRLAFVARLGFGVVALAACDKRGPVQRPPGDNVPVAAPAEPEPVTPEPEAPPAVESAAAESEDLATEAPEADPASKTVKLRLDVAPRSARPVVWWGKQKLGEAPLTIERPRRSGPLNLVIRAEGYLDHHTRLFTDRDDRLAVVLVRPNEAAGMLGFKRKPGTASPPASGAGGTDARPPTPALGDAGAFVVPQGVTF